MATYGDLQSEIADELNRSNLTSQIQKTIQEAIHKYERERFYFNETRTSLATVAGQAYIAVPDDMVYEDILIITVGNANSALEKRGYHWIEERVNNSITGIPTDYAVYQNQFRLHPVPNAVYTVTLSYVKRLSTLSQENDSNDWTTAGYDLIKATAKRLIYSHYLHEPNNMALAMQSERTAFMALRGETDQRLMVGHAKATAW